jgi:hypothetical protein
MLEFLSAAQQSCEIDDETFRALRAFSILSPIDKLAGDYFAADLALVRSGYKLLLVGGQPTSEIDDEPSGESEVPVIIPVWMRFAGGRWFCEVFAYHSFQVTSTDQRALIKDLLSLISDVAKNIKKYDHFDKSHHRFARQVFPQE